MCLIRGAAVALASASLPAAALSQGATSMPPPAYSVAVAYHETEGHVLLFGGFLDGAYHGRTWTWDGESWSLRDRTGPSARNAPAMAYDAARGQVVLFGGDTGAAGPFGDTWLWDGDAWTRASVSGPPARTVHALVYDSARERTVLFGGASGDRVLGDTWEWDGETWTLVSVQGPSARALHGMAYDATRDRVVLFGGTSELSPTASPYGDTWEWDGTVWTRVSTAGPGPRDHVALGHDHARGVVVLHGGGQGDETRQTWTWDGADWYLASTAGPSRRFARLEWDPHAERLLMYGGFDRGPSNELWSWDGVGWERVEPVRHLSRWASRLYPKTFGEVVPPLLTPGRRHPVHASVGDELPQVLVEVADVGDPEESRRPRTSHHVDRTLEIRGGGRLDGGTEMLEGSAELGNDLRLLLRAGLEGRRGRR